MSAEHYQPFAIVAGGLCLMAWIVMLAELGSLSRQRAVFSKRLRPLGYAILSLVVLLLVVAGRPVGVYKGQGIVIGVVMAAVMGTWGYLTGRYTKNY